MRSNFSEHLPQFHDESRKRFGRTFDARRSLGLRFNQPIEGWIAAAAVGVAAVGSAYSAYSSSQSQKDALEYQANNTPKLTSYTPVTATYDPNAGVSQYLGAQTQYGGQAQQAASRQNAYYQQSIDSLAPVTKNLGIAGKNVTRELNGQLPKDLSGQIARSSAQVALTGGYGADSGQGRNLSARDFGLSSLDLQQRGLNNLGLIEGLAAKLNPVSSAQLIGDPSQYANRNDNYVFRNQQTQNDAAKDAAGVVNQNAANQYQAGLAGIQASSINPYAGAIASGAGAAAGAYMGYAGKQATGANYYGTNGMGYNTNGYYAPPQAAYGAYGSGATLGYTPGQGGGYYSTWGGG